MHEAKIIRLEGSIGLTRAALGRQAVEALGLEDAVDRVPVQVGQEVGDYESEVIEREAGRAAQRADDRTLFLAGLPGQLMRPGRVVLAVVRSALAPLPDGLRRHPKAPGQHACGLPRAGDLSTDSRGGAGLRMNGVHQRLLVGSGTPSPSKRHACSLSAKRT